MAARLVNGTRLSTAAAPAAVDDDEDDDDVRVCKPRSTVIIR